MEEAVTKRLVTIVSPVLSTEKRVEVAKAAVELEIKKSIEGGMAAPEVVVELAAIVKKPVGEVVPKETREAKVLFAEVEVETR